MDRPEARKRIEQVLESVNAMLVDGRCSKCDAIGRVRDRVPTPEAPSSAQDERDSQEQPFPDLEFDHRQGCPMDEDLKNAVRLMVQFKLYGKEVVVQAERGPVRVFRLATETED